MGASGVSSKDTLFLGAARLFHKSFACLPSEIQGLVSYGVWLFVPPTPHTLHPTPYTLFIHLSQELDYSSHL